MSASTIGLLRACTLLVLTISSCGAPTSTPGQNNPKAERGQIAMAFVSSVGELADVPRTCPDFVVSGDHRRCLTLLAKEFHALRTVDIQSMAESPPDGLPTNLSPLDRLTLSHCNLAMRDVVELSRLFSVDELVLSSTTLSPDAADSSHRLKCKEVHFIDVKVSTVRRHLGSLDFGSLLGFGLSQIEGEPEDFELKLLARGTNLRSLRLSGLNVMIDDESPTLLSIEALSLHKCLCTEPRGASRLISIAMRCKPSRSLRLDTGDVTEGELRALVKSRAPKQVILMNLTGIDGHGVNRLRKEFPTVEWEVTPAAEDEH